MKKNKKVDAVRVFNHAAVVLEDAAHDFDDAMRCLRRTLLDVHFAAQDRGESVAALEREADAFRDDEKLRRFFVSAAVDARNGYDLNAEDMSGVREALRVAHSAVDAVAKQRARLDAAINAAEKQLAEVEYQLADFETQKVGGEIDLDALMPDEVALRVAKAFRLYDGELATVGDALAAISERGFHLTRNLDKINLGSAAGGTGNDLNAVASQIKRFEDIKSRINLFDRIGSQRNSDCIADSVHKQASDSGA